MKAFGKSAFALAAGMSIGAASQAVAQEVVLKVHHFLPPPSLAHSKFITPWCDRIAKDSGGKMKCQIYPAMQLGGTPPQLFDQVKDGVVDIVWTLPGYTAGRFPLSEVFELPFMMTTAEATSQALWEYATTVAASEYKDVKPLAFHVHGPGQIHMIPKPIKSAADFKGLKVRAPTRQTNKMLAALGATPVGMPVPQVSEALSKGVIDGAVVPYEVVPAIKAHELTKFTSETDPKFNGLYTSVFIFGMNKAKYDGLPADLKKVIDANSGLALSALAGRTWDEGEIPARKLVEAKNPINVVPASELAAWKKLTDQLDDAWVADMTSKGFDGKAALKTAQDLIQKHTKK